MSREILIARFEGGALKLALVGFNSRGPRLVELEAVVEGQPSKFAGKDAFLIIPEEDRSLRHFLLPAAPLPSVVKMARLQAEQRLPGAESGYVMDQLIRKNGKRFAALVAALPVKRLEQRVQALKDAGVGLDGLLLEPFYFAGLLPEKGRVRIALETPTGVQSLALRDGVPVGWDTTGNPAALEEYFTDAPISFKPDKEFDAATLCRELNASQQQLSFLAAALHSQSRQRMEFSAFLLREEAEPASKKRLALCAAVWAAGLVLAFAAAWTSLLKMESERSRLKEMAETKKSAATLSKNVGTELGKLATLSVQLRKRSVEKPYALSTVASLAELMPAGVRMTALSFNADGQFQMDCEARDAQAPPLFMDLLRRAPGVREPALEYLSDRGTEKLAFRVTCKAEALELAPKKISGKKSASGSKDKESSE